MLIVGWRERIDLPLLGLSNLKAKIDTGARTSALHATHIEAFQRDETPWVRFQTRFDDDANDAEIECPVHDMRDIKNTSGIPETRYVIRTKFRLAKRLWMIDLSLTERTDMKFRMIVGRSALLKHNVLVDPGKTYLTAPTMEINRKERRPSS